MSPPNEFDAAGSVTIHLDFDVGRTSTRMGRYELTGGDAMAQAAVVDSVSCESPDLTLHIALSDELPTDGRYQGGNATCSSLK